MRVAVTLQLFKLHVDVCKGFLNIGKTKKHDTKVRDKVGERVVMKLFEAFHICSSHHLNMEKVFHNSKKHS